MYGHFAILAGLVLIYSLISGVAEKTPFNGALVFVAVGVALGSFGFGVLDIEFDAEFMRTIAELTLALVLFTDAATAKLRVLRRSLRIPRRLLLLGLPLTVALGFGVGWLLFDDLGLFELAILAALLAPTDAALGKSVVTDESVPARIREGLKVESGLNDGICVPLVLLFLALATGQSRAEGLSIFALELFAKELGIGVVAGAALGGAGAWLLGQAARRHWMDEDWGQIPVVALSVVCFAVAQSLGGSGFIAVFVGGLVFGALAHEHKHQLLLAVESTGDMLALVTWVVFGAAMIGAIVHGLSWQVVVYALASLTVIRMVPVLLVLLGLDLSWGERLFMAWFGPRGLASVVFVGFVLAESLPHGELIASTAICTIVLSVVAHGLSAPLLVRALARRSSEQGSAARTDGDPSNDAR